MSSNSIQANTATPKHKHIFFIDNFDSFSYNIVYALQELNCTVEVMRNTIEPSVLKQSIFKCTQQQHQAILVLSPGPSSPNEAGNLMSIIEHFAFKIPMLGICLGHQALGLYLGGKVIKAPVCVHGKTSTIQHSNSHCFSGLPQDMPVARYHSLVVADLPQAEHITKLAHSNDGLLMAFYATCPPKATQSKASILRTQKHTYKRNELSELDLLSTNSPMLGLQFHPESILTTYGNEILKQSLLCLTDNSLCQPHIFKSFYSFGDLENNLPKPQAESLDFSCHQQ